MPNLTDNQAALIRYIVAAHKGGQTAKVSPLHGFHPATLKSLVARGLVRKLYTTAVHTPRGWINGQYRFQHSLVDEVELTRQGWDHVYGFKSQPTAVAA